MSTLYTWGYSRHTLDDLRQVCQKYGIKRIYDVRARPTSRRPEWRETSLRNYFGDPSCHSRYLPIPLLGNQARSLPWERFQEWESAAREVVWHLQFYDCLLLCLETDPAQCHRSEWRRRFAICVGVKWCTFNRNRPNHGAMEIPCRIYGKK